MTVNLGDYATALNDLLASYHKQIDRLNLYNKSLHIYDDGTKIEWTPAQQAKALAEAQADVELLVAIYNRLRTSLGVT